ETLPRPQPHLVEPLIHPHWHREDPADEVSARARPGHFARPNLSDPPQAESRGEIDHLTTTDLCQGLGAVAGVAAEHVGLGLAMPGEVDGARSFGIDADRR